MAWKPVYATADEFKEVHQIDTGDELDDLKIGLDLAAASRAIDRHCHRQFGQVAAPVVRYYTTELDPTRSMWVASIDDLQDPDGLTVTYGGSAIAGAVLKPRNALADGKPYTELWWPQSGSHPGTGHEMTEVEAKWGWTAVPDTIKDACILQAARFYKRKDAPFGVAGSPEQGSELRLLAKVDADVMVMLDDYVRRWFAA